MHDNILLEIEHLTKVFDDGSPGSGSKGRSSTEAGRIVVVDDLSFQVFEGELLVLLGPSGCGKTTLLRILGGLEEPTGGIVKLDGKEIHGPGRDRGMVFQSYSSFPWLTVLDNVKFGLKYRSEIAKRDWSRIAQHFIDLVGLTGFENYYVAQLSGGMQQRVAIGRTLAANPRMLLMDEPFGALDAQTREFLQLALLQIRNQEKKTIVFVTHDVEEAIFLADRALVLTARPATIAAEVDVDLPHPRELTTKTTDQFLTVERAVLQRVRDEARKGSAWHRVAQRASRLRDEHRFSERRHYKRSNGQQ